MIEVIEEVEVEVSALEPFKILYNLPNGTNMVICIGGRGGAKTYEVSKFTAYSASVLDKRIAVLRDEKERIRESILNEIFKRYDTANEYGHFDALFDKLDTGLKDKRTGEMCIFTQGFRASSKEKKSALKGISDVDIAVIEEAEDIRSFQKFNTFKDSIKKKGRLFIVMLNTPDVRHWIVERYFEKEPVLNEQGQATGYFKLKPRKIEGFVCIQTNYKDNPYLPEDLVRDYEGYGDPKSHLYDPHYYFTEILGYASSGRKGQIITKAKSITLDEYHKLPYKEIYGLDFGTASPAGLVGVKMHRNFVWVRQLNYKPMDILEIGKMLCRLNITASDVIVADSADPLSINKLISGWGKEELSLEDAESFPQLMKGFFVVRALKPPGSIAYGISELTGRVLHVCIESTDYWNEIDNYIYAVDKYDKPTGDPVDDYNHLIDPTRYVVTGEGKIF